MIEHQRYKGTVGIIRGGRKFTVQVTDTETKEVVLRDIVPARDFDGAVVQAKELAKEWGKSHD